LSLNLRFGDLVILCFAQRAGAMSLKKGGRKGLVNFNINKLILTINNFSFEL